MMQKVRLSVTIDEDAAAELDAAVEAGEFPSREGAVVAALADWRASRILASLDMVELRRSIDEACAAADRGEVLSSEEVRRRWEARWTAEGVDWRR